MGKHKQACPRRVSRGGRGAEMVGITEKSRTRGVRSWKGGKEFNWGNQGEEFSFSEHFPPQACLEVTTHDTAEGC